MTDMSTSRHQDAARFAAISERILQARRAAGLTQIEAAERMGISRVQYGRLEKGYHRVEDYTLKIAQAFDVEPSWLMLEEETPREQAERDLRNAVLYVDRTKIDRILSSRSWKDARRDLRVFRDFSDPDKVHVLAPDVFMEGSPQWVPIGGKEATDLAKALQTRCIELANHLHAFPEDELKARQEDNS